MSRYNTRVGVLDVGYLHKRRVRETTRGHIIQYPTARETEMLMEGGLLEFL